MPSPPDGASPDAPFRSPESARVATSFEDPIDDSDRAAIIDMLAALHTAIPKGIQVPTRPLQLANRPAIDQALASLDVPWTGGP